MEDGLHPKHPWIIHTTKYILTLKKKSHHKAILSTQHSHAHTITHDEGACASGAAIWIAGCYRLRTWFRLNSETVDGS
jgi:hypothetical protein